MVPRPEQGFRWGTSLSRPLVRGLINGRSGLICASAPDERFDVVVSRSGGQVALSVMPENRDSIGTVGMGVAVPEIPESRIRRQSRGPLKH